MRGDLAMNGTAQGAGGERSDLSAGALAGRYPRWMKVVFWVSLAIALAAAVRRAVALLTPVGSGAPPQLATLDAYFATQAALTWVHITCATAFVVLLPFVFWRRGWVALERAFFALGAVVGATAYAMSAHAVGGWVERSAVLLFNTLFLLSLARAFALERRGDTSRRRRWMLRATAILLGIATTRPVMGVFFATSPLTHLTPQRFFGIAFWIGWSINTLGMELWLRTRGAAAKGGQA